MNTQSRLNESTTQLADWATEVVRPMNRDAASQVVTAEGAKRGVRVYQYDQDQDTLMIWGAADVPGNLGHRSVPGGHEGHTDRPGARRAVRREELSPGPAAVSVGPGSSTVRPLVRMTRKAR